MRQAITTKYIGPTNVKGSRVKASCQAGSITLHWDHSLNNDDNHMAAAKALAAKWDWNGTWFGGFNHDSQGVFVLVEAGSKFFSIEKPHAPDCPATDGFGCHCEEITDLKPECPRCGLTSGDHRYPCV